MKNKKLIKWSVEKTKFQLNFRRQGAIQSNNAFDRTACTQTRIYITDHIFEKIRQMTRLQELFSQSSQNHYERRRVADHAIYTLTHSSVNIENNSIFLCLLHTRSSLLIDQRFLLRCVWISPQVTSKNIHQFGYFHVNINIMIVLTND